MVIFILHLIDKHNLWGKAAKITIWTLALAIVAGGCLYGWVTWEDKREAKQRQAESVTLDFSKAQPIAITPNPVGPTEPMPTAPKLIKPPKPFGNEKSRLTSRSCSDAIRQRISRRCFMVRA